jgi:transcriptional regulator with XRE-family HTH domain
MTPSPAWKKESDFGKLVRLLRDAKGLTQRDLILFGVKQSYLANLETGGIDNPSPAMIASIARGLGVKGAASCGTKRAHIPGCRLPAGVLPEQRLQETCTAKIPDRDAHPLPVQHRTASGQRQIGLRGQILPLLRDRVVDCLPIVQKTDPDRGPRTDQLHHK